MAVDIDAAREVARDDAAIAAEIDGRIVALNIEQGVCYGLNAVASRVWAMMAQPIRISEICDALIETYDIDRVTCEAETIALVRDLANIGLAKV